MIDASKLGEEYKDGGNQKRRLRDDEVDKIVNAFTNQEVIEDFSVAVTHDEIISKKYSLSAGQYFEVKLDYTEMTSDAFIKRMVAYTSALESAFTEGKNMGDELISQLKSLCFEEE